ncbi:MAG TPA: VWA domain-containing protein [Verrucomicrobiae bacterium]|jgi:Ca-activated chloride channel family protein|nr:VWA domain-containing protein [Verrucomicrobiae bacterium]
MRFEHPNILWLLLVIPPAMAFLFWFANRQKQKLLAQFVSARLLPTLTTGISPARQKLRFAFLILAVAFLIFALARPQYGFDLEEVQQNGLDIVVAIDTSKSMLTTDIAPNRLERAKLAALELMQRAGADRMGLVAFAGDAFLECPLTIDNTAFQQSVQALNVNSIPQGGTAIAEAINTALTAFKEKGHYQALVLLTDGEDNDSETGALAAAQNAAKAGLKIFTIGIGTAAGDLIRVTDANGNSDYVRDEQGNVVKSHLNENLLQQIAGATGGFYLPLRGADTMDTLYERGLEPLPKSESSEKLIRRYHEQFQWPLAIAILFLLAEMFLPERKKSKVQSPKSKVKAAAVAILIAILLLPVAAKASPADALRDYNSGNYTNALTEFSRLAEIQTNDLRLVFDAGTAAYRATNYDEALKNFQLVTLSPDLKLQQQAFYNLGNTFYRMGELKFTPDADGLGAMTETWTNALQSYAHAAQLNTNDVDAAFNFGFVKSQLDLIAQLREAMRRAKLSADDAIRRDEFHRAYEIMEQLTQNKIAAKQFQDYTKKLKDIDAIATPNQK